MKHIGHTEFCDNPRCRGNCKPGAKLCKHGRKFCFQCQGGEVERMVAFEKWLKTAEGRQCLATGEHAREQSLRLAFLLGVKNA